MQHRIREICSNLPKVETLADVGCDHGFCTKYALDHGLCERAIISDISAGSLKKAELLLKAEIADGKCSPVLADGLEGVPYCDCVLVAGLGGEEIIRIFTDRQLPPHFVFQPMKNSEKVREFLLQRGVKIVRDYTFREGMYFYDLIAGEFPGTDTYSGREILFGRENLKERPRAFTEKLQSEIKKVRVRLEIPMQEESRKELLNRLQIFEETLYDGKRNL